MSKNQSVTEKEVGWRVTAMNVDCETVEDETTVMVYRDWSIACSHFVKLGYARQELRSGLHRLLSKLGVINLNRCIYIKACKGPADCTILIQWRDKLRHETQDLKNNES